MSGKRYWKNRLPFLVVNLFCMAALTLFLQLNGISRDSLTLILIIWLTILTAGLCSAWHKRRRQMDTLLHMTERLEERYLIAELMEMPDRADDQVFYQVLKMAEKSMLERIGTIQAERMEYKEYIEQWVHEIKTPITAMKLSCENDRSPLARKLLSELEKTSRFAEQVLYYARSEHTENDYPVREIPLFDAVHRAISDNKHLLLQNGVTVNVEDTGFTVCSDDKWLCFILNQLISNAVKYRTANPVLEFRAERRDNQVLLFVRDNGIGIRSGDLPRIFDKGFTGVNGRSSGNSTGIGLYLCKRLCDKLGIAIDAQSECCKTTIILSFYMNHFINQVKS